MQVEPTYTRTYIDACLETWLVRGTRTMPEENSRASRSSRKYLRSVERESGFRGMVDETSTAWISMQDAHLKPYASSVAEGEFNPPR